MKKKEPVLSYEEAVAELESILQKLSAEETTLEESLTLYARAAQLIADCNALLKKAELQMETIAQTLQGLQEEPEDDV